MAGPAPISLAEIETYCRIHGMTDVDEVVLLVQALDRTFLAHHQDGGDGGTKGRDQR